MAGWAAELGVKGNTKVKLMLLKHKPGQSLKQLIKDAMSQVPPRPLRSSLCPKPRVRNGLGLAWCQRHSSGFQYRRR